MPKIKWDEQGKKWYENGVKNGVLYPLDLSTVNATVKYHKGVAWNGLTNVSKSPEGAEPNDLWADNIKYGSLRSAETFSGKIEAYTYPDEFSPCLGNENPTSTANDTTTTYAGIYLGQQKHQPFGFCFRSEIGNDAGGEHYKLHIVWNATANPSEESYDTINDSPDAITFSWDFDTVPVSITVDGKNKTVSTITVDTRYLSNGTSNANLATLEGWLYGVDSSGIGGSTIASRNPTLPNPEQVIAILTTGSATGLTEADAT